MAGVVIKYHIFVHDNFKMSATRIMKNMTVRYDALCCPIVSENGKDFGIIS